MRKILDTTKYARYRRELIRRGVELFELRSETNSEKKSRSLLAGRSKASMHTNAGVVDRKIVVIGSFSLDPRSATLYTEIVPVVDSTELASQDIDFMDYGVKPENSRWHRFSVWLIGWFPAEKHL